MKTEIVLNADCVWVDEHSVEELLESFHSTGFGSTVIRNLAESELPRRTIKVADPNTGVVSEQSVPDWGQADSLALVKAAKRKAREYIERKLKGR